MGRKKKEPAIPKDYVPLSKMLAGSDKIIRICNQSNCNKEFIATSKYIRTCPECKKNNFEYINCSEIDYYDVIK